jgi:two-component system, NtrC family, sensor kinase
MPVVLVVDDQPEDRKPLAKLLKTKGFQVVTASNAFEAMAAAQREDPDLILLDVAMPPMDGLTVLMLLRDSEIGRNTPVIVITGMNDSNTISRAQNLRVKEIFIKNSFAIPELLEAVDKHIRRTEPPNEQPSEESASA